MFCQEDITLVDKKYRTGISMLIIPAVIFLRQKVRLNPLDVVMEPEAEPDHKRLRFLRETFFSAVIAVILYV